MALRDQPYIPLYVQDFMTDEKLIECSAESTGIYIRLMCIMHKSEPYGAILLKQKDKQTVEQVENFALKLARQMPYQFDQILRGLNELLSESVIQIEGDLLYQKRMIADNDLSLKRADAGKKGGKFAQAKLKAKDKANTENKNENENVIESIVVTKKGAKNEILKIAESMPEFVKDFIQYRSEIKKPFRSVKQFQTWVNQLRELSKGSTKEARKIVQHTIANGYQGIFAPTKTKESTDTRINLTQLMAQGPKVSLQQEYNWIPIEHKTKNQ